MRRSLFSLMIIVAAALALFPATTAARSAADEPVALKFKWIVGEVLRYRMTLETSSELTGPQEITSTQKQVMTFRQETRDVAPDGAATVVMTIDSIVVDAETPAGKDHFDSAAPDEGKGSPMSKSYAAMVGQPITLEIAPNGTIAKVTGFDKIVDRMLAGREGPMADQMARVLRKTFNDDMIRRMYEPAFRVVPDHPVKPGESWPMELELPLPMIGTLKSTNTLTLAGIDGEGAQRTARLGAAGTFSHTPAGADPDDPTGGMMTFKFDDGTVTGETLFNIQGGHVDRSQSTTRMKMSMSMDAGGQNMTMKQSMTSTMLMELLPADTAAPTAPAPKPEQ